MSLITDSKYKKIRSREKKLKTNIKRTRTKRVFNIKRVQEISLDGKQIEKDQHSKLVEAVIEENGKLTIKINEVVGNAVR